MSGPAEDGLRGVYAVFQTPFTADGEIDLDTLRREIEWMFAQGVDGIVMAMVSEVLRLSTEERVRLAATACELGLQYGGVVISVGAESTHSAVRFARAAERAGASAVMAIPPVSIPVLEDELLGYYGALFDEVSVPVVVQDAGGYVGRPMPIALQAGLFDRYGDRALFKPEADPIGPRLTQLMEATGGRARVFEGSGGIALVDSHRRGIAGTMPGADLCWAIVALWEALERGDTATVDALNGPLTDLVALQTGLDGFLAVEKHLLHRQGVFPNTVVRGPVGYVLGDKTRSEVDDLFDRLRAAADKAGGDGGAAPPGG